MELMKAFRALLFMALISTVSSAQVPQAIIETPSWPENPPESWLTYHLAHPGPGAATPGDPNPAFFWNGRYHLHYIYNNNGIKFAHVSSEDMVHWKWHPTELGPSTMGHGMFSGTGFITQNNATRWTEYPCLRHFCYTPRCAGSALRDRSIVL